MPDAGRARAAVMLVALAACCAAPAQDTGQTAPPSGRQALGTGANAATQTAPAADVPAQTPAAARQTVEDAQPASAGQPVEAGASRWSWDAMVLRTGQHPIITAGVLAGLSILVSGIICLVFLRKLRTLRRSNDERGEDLRRLRAEIVALQKPQEKPVSMAQPPTRPLPQRPSRQQKSRALRGAGLRDVSLKERASDAVPRNAADEGESGVIRAQEPSAAEVGSTQTSEPARAAGAAPAASPVQAVTVITQPEWRVRTGIVLRDYNTARAHEAAEWFHEHYRCTGLSCQNLTDFRVNPGAELRFEASGYGMFLGGTEDGFLLPSFDRDYAAARSSFEGIFEYPSNSAGPFVLAREARVVRRGELWVLRQPGEMTLG